MILAEFRDLTLSALKSLAIRGGGAAVNQIAQIAESIDGAGVVSIEF